MRIRAFKHSIRIALCAVSAVIVSFCACERQNTRLLEPTPDTTAPRLISVSPEPGSSDLDPYVTTILTFNEKVDTQLCLFELAPHVDGEVVVLNNTIQFVPRAELVRDVSYRARFKSLVLDTIGNVLILDKTWSFKIRGGDSLFVAIGGTGDGSRHRPLGSLQLALDSAANNSSISVVMVGSGIYAGPIEISSPMSLIASRDPSNDWQASASDSTLIVGGVFEGIPTSLILANIHGGIGLHRCAVSGESATLSEGSAYGALIINCDNVYLNRCSITSGKGYPGIDGEPGQAGVSGAISDVAPGGKGGSGGVRDCTITGYDNNTHLPIWICGPSYGRGLGEQGYCSDGTQSGGLGSGGQGQSGSSGVTGRGASQKITLLDNRYSRKVSGEWGEVAGAGGWGCGGGGGDGGEPSGHGISTPSAPGCDGAKGGNGGGPGTPGTPGSYGGSSIAIVAVNCGLTLNSVVLRSSGGGHGGAGGRGGTGGPGQLGTVGSASYCVQTSGLSGSGGNGGDGGNAGGGAGGASIGVLNSNSSVFLEPGVTFEIPPGGAGGNPSGTPAAYGLSRQVYKL